MSNPAPLRIAFVGVGHWHAPQYLQTLGQLGERIVAVWDPDPAVAGRAAETYHARTEPDLAELLTGAHADLIVGMGVHAQMPELVAQMLAVPGALLLEKPLGIHARDLAPLVEQVERENRFAAVAFVNRYTPLWRRWAELQEAGRLGPPCYAHFRVINGAPQRYRRDQVGWMLEPDRSGGGSLINLGTHTLDAFRRFAGDEISVLSAQLGYRVHHAPVEDYSLAILKSASGVLGSVESGYCYAGMSGGDQEYRLVTGNAYLIQRADTLTVKTLDDDRLETLPALPAAEAYARFVQDSLLRLRGGEPPIATLRDAWHVLELVDEIYRVARRSDDDN